MGEADPQPVGAELDHGGLGHHFALPHRPGRQGGQGGVEPTGGGQVGLAVEGPLDRIERRSRAGRHGGRPPVGHPIAPPAPDEAEGAGGQQRPARAQDQWLGRDGLTIVERRGRPVGPR